jgi:hypothetical protein
VGVLALTGIELEAKQYVLDHRHRPATASASPLALADPPISRLSDDPT